MDNPWLHIPLADYEGHMGLPQIGQDRMLADVFAAALERYRPGSVAVLGCAGGNGFERIATDVTRRVVGVDLNPGYIREARARFGGRLPGLELFAGDVQVKDFAFTPVELVYAGLLFEYVEVDTVLTRIRAMLRSGGTLLTVVQLPCAATPEVTGSPYASLGELASIMRLVAPGSLKRAADALGYRETDAYTVQSAGGKGFRIQSFRQEDCGGPQPATGDDRTERNETTADGAEG